TLGRSFLLGWSFFCLGGFLDRLAFCDLRFRLLDLGGRDRDAHHHGFGVLQIRDTLDLGQVGDAEHASQLQVTDVELDEPGDLGDQRFDLHHGPRWAEDSAFLDADRLTFEMHRDLGGDGLVEGDLLEVDVPILAAIWMSLDDPGHREDLLSVVGLERDEGVEAGVGVQSGVEVAGVDSDTDRLHVAAVDDGGHLAFAAQAAGSTRTGSPARPGAQTHLFHDKDSLRGEAVDNDYARETGPPPSRSGDQSSLSQSSVTSTKWSSIASGVVPLLRKEWSAPSTQTRVAISSGATCCSMRVGVASASRSPLRNRVGTGSDGRWSTRSLSGFPGGCRGYPYATTARQGSP